MIKNRSVPVDTILPHVYYEDVAAATSPSQLGGLSQTIMIIVEDLESHYQTSLAQKVSIVEPLNVTEYGEQHYVAVDQEGHQWIFAKHVRDVAPEEWGAELS